jgi:hypothetical protein
LHPTLNTSPVLVTAALEDSRLLPLVERQLP